MTIIIEIGVGGVELSGDVHGPSGSCACHTHGGLRQAVNCAHPISARESWWVEEIMLNAGHVVRDIGESAKEAYRLVEENRAKGEAASWDSPRNSLWDLEHRNEN